MKVVVLTVSDTRSIENDISGEALERLVQTEFSTFAERILVSDEKGEISSKLKELCDRGNVDLILTTGGTGLSPRDNTPEATKEILDKEAPGIAEAIRAESAKHTVFAMLSRGTAGVCKRTLIINFPGSPKGVVQCFNAVKEVLFHAVKLVHGNTEHD